MTTMCSQKGRVSSIRAMGRADGFTLLELLVVMGIMILLMTAGIGGYFQMRRGAEMRGAISTVRNTLMLARQQAVTKHRNVQVFFNPDPSNTVTVVEIISGATNQVHTPAALPPGIQFNPPLPASGMIAFSPMGSTGGVGTSTINLKEKTAGKGGVQMAATITVWLLTGVTQVMTSP